MAVRPREMNYLQIILIQEEELLKTCFKWFFDMLLELNN